MASRARTRSGICLALAAMTTACTIPVVPTAPARIDWIRNGRHGSYAKAGVPLSGTTCGEQYQRAVTGNAEAERLMAECSTATMAYAAFETGFVVLPGLGLAAGAVFGHDHDATGRWFAAGATLGVASFIAGFVMGWRAGGLRDHAIRVYNASTARTAAAAD